MTHVVVIWEGYIVPNCIVRLELGGRDITDMTKLLVEDRGYDLTSKYANDENRRIVQRIKEDLGYVALDYNP